MRIFIIVLVAFLFILTPQDAKAQNVTTTLSKDVVSLTKGNYYIHTVKRRETIFGITKAYGIDAQTLVDENPKIRTEGLQPRQTIMIPTPETYKRLKSLEPPVAKRGEQRPAQSPVAAVAKPVLPPSSAAVPFVSVPDYEEAPVELPKTQMSDPDRVAAPMANEPLRMALLLPFGGTASMNENAADFYAGALMAMGELRDKEAANIEISLYSTAGSVEKTVLALENAVNVPHVVIGPIYPKPFAQAAKWAAMRGVPIVSPLTTVDDYDSQTNPFVIQVPPVSTDKYEKIRALFSPTANVVLVIPEVGLDTATLAEMQALMPVSASTMQYNRVSGVAKIKGAVVSDRENIFLIPTSHQGAVEEILSRIASLNSVVKRYDITVVGTPRWKTLNNVNPDLYFRTQTIYPSSYFSDRSNDVSDKFFRDYVENFSRVPSPITMRGYDLVKIFYESFRDNGARVLSVLGSNGAILTPAQTPYLFENVNGHNSMKLNRQWVLVKHNADFTITTL